MLTCYDIQEFNVTKLNETSPGRIFRSSHQINEIPAKQVPSSLPVSISKSKVFIHQLGGVPPHAPRHYTMRLRTLVVKVGEVENL